MRVLEARFHPGQRSGQGFVVVGRLVWRGERRSEPPIVEPAPSLDHLARPTTMLSKLHYLVSLTAPESFERLQALRSRFWSFVDVTPDPQEGGH
jgi:hypothetical protein